MRMAKPWEEEHLVSPLECEGPKAGRHPAYWKQYLEIRAASTQSEVGGGWTPAGVQEQELTTQGLTACREEFGPYSQGSGSLLRQNLSGMR